MKMFGLSKILLMVLLIAHMLVSCSDESGLNSSIDELSSSIDEATLRSEKSKKGVELLTISYEMDATTITQFDCDPTRFDIAAGAPIADKQKVEMTIKDNGSVKLITESLPSKNNFDGPHQSLPNDQPKVSKTILDNGEMQLYDAGGRLIKSVPGQSIDMPSVANQMSDILSNMDIRELDISNLIACSTSNMSFDGLRRLIATAPYNENVKKMSDDIYTIRILEVPYGSTATEVGHVVNIVDINRKVLMASRLYDENDEVIQTMMYQYDDCTLKGFRQEVHQELPDCKKATLLTFAEISNLDFKYLK